MISIGGAILWQCADADTENHIENIIGGKCFDGWHLPPIYL